MVLSEKMKLLSNSDQYREKMMISRMTLKHMVFIDVENIRHVTNRNIHG